MIQAFATREVNELWWFGLIGGILMTILAFWTGGSSSSRRRICCLSSLASGR
jgi:hypothetical protein